MVNKALEKARERLAKRRKRKAAKRKRKQSQQALESLQIERRVERNDPEGVVETAKASAKQAKGVASELGKSVSASKAGRAASKAGSSQATEAVKSRARDFAEGGPDDLDSALDLGDGPDYDSLDVVDGGGEDLDALGSGAAPGTTLDVVDDSGGDYDGVEAGMDADIVEDL